MTMKGLGKIAIGCMVVLAGCQQAEEVEIESEELPMSIEASIGDSHVMAGRYVGNEPNSVSFCEDDKIGLSVDGVDFDGWIYDGTSWKRIDGSVASWGDKVNFQIFRAFYPYNDEISEGTIIMPALSDQDGSMGRVAECDFLVATKTDTYATSKGVVSFTGENAFQHVSSLVKITLRGEGSFASAQVEKISLMGTGIVRTSTYSFVEPNVGVKLDNNEAGNSLDLPVSCNMDSKNHTFYCILNSGTVNLASVTMIIEYIEGDGQKYKAELKGLGDASTKFESGKQYSYTLKIDDGILSIIGNSIKGWTDGTSMDVTINGVEQNNQTDENP